MNKKTESKPSLQMSELFLYLWNENMKPNREPPKNISYIILLKLPNVFKINLYTNIL